MRTLLCFAIMLAAVPGVLVPGVLAQQPAASSEEPEDYPGHRDRDATFYTCTGCHGFKIVAAQALNREQWEGVLNLMSQKHSMPALEGRARAGVLDYLSATFPMRTLPPGRQSPFAPR